MPTVKDEIDEYLIEKVLEKAKELGWDVTRDDKNITFSSVAQDFEFDVSGNDTVDGLLHNIYEHYDVLEETRMWMGSNDPTTFSCQIAILKLYDELREYTQEERKNYKNIVEEREARPLKLDEEVESSSNAVSTTYQTAVEELQPYLDEALEKQQEEQLEEECMKSCMTRTRDRSLEHVAEMEKGR